MDCDVSKPEKRRCSKVHFILPLFCVCPQRTQNHQQKILVAALKHVNAQRLMFVPIFPIMITRL